MRRSDSIQKRKGLRSFSAGLLALALAFSLLTGLTACRDASAESGPSASAAEEAVSWQLPVVTEDSSMSTGQKTTWQCVYFGSYPQTEIVDGAMTAVDDYALLDGDYVSDPDLYAALVSADWTDDTTELDGVTYCRMTGTDAVTASTDRVQHYRWTDTTEYHYFRYDPIRWRILDEEDGVLTLVSDRILDGGRYSDTAEDVTWSESAVRAFLNGEFFDTAFTETEQAAVVCAQVENTPNAYYGTDCGEDTQDYVYLLSNEETFHSDTAARYGFMEGNGYDDASRRFTSTLYAKCRGVWWSPVEDYRGNSFWFMRTSGYTASNVSYICDFGYIYAFGTSVICDDAGLLPVIRLDTSLCLPESAGTVSSDEIVKDSSAGTEAAEETTEEDDTEAPAETETRDYETLTFGSYPRTEIVDGAFTAVDDYALEDGDYVADAALYAALEKAEWTNDITELDGVRYLRIAASDTSGASCGRSQHYDWADLSAYHYFRFDPITWRVLREEDGRLYLMADRALDCVRFSDETGDTVWADSSIRAWLNGEFRDMAFTEEEQAQLLDTETRNADNHYFGTACGETTTDQVFLLAESDTFVTEEAAENGFYLVDYGGDPARRISSTLFAKCRGAWWTPVDDRDGNCFWILRTNGYNNSSVVYVDENGDMYNRGCSVSTADAGIVPAICLAAD